jgi:hypothetical protein
MVEFTTVKWPDDSSIKSLYWINDVYRSSTTVILNCFRNRRLGTEEIWNSSLPLKSTDIFLRSIKHSTDYFQSLFSGQFPAYLGFKEPFLSYCKYNSAFVICDILKKIPNSYRSSSCRTHVFTTTVSYTIRIIQRRKVAWIGHTFCVETVF